MNQLWKDNSAWFGEYTIGYMAALAQQGVAPGSFGTPQQQAAAHQFARGVADTGRLLPGTPEFDAAVAQVRSDVIPQGALFNDQSRMNMLEGMYDFSEEISWIDLQVGAQYRVFDLRSNGTIFADVEGNDITISEWGGFAQASKRLFADKFKVTGSIRYDKNENFAGQFSPRISGVLTEGNHNIRLSYQTGFRMPTTQAQHIDLNVVSARLIGGLPFYREKYDIFTNSFTQASVNQYIAAVGAGASPVSPAATSLLVPATEELIPELRPEQVRSIEVGYKSLLANNRLLIDAAYYYNIFNDFITLSSVRRAPGPVFPTPANAEQLAINALNAPTLLTPITTPGQENTFQTYTNITGRNILAHGAAIGLQYNLPKNYTLSGNYNFNRLITDVGEDFLAEFNTPEHKFNIIFGNRKLTRNFGFNVAYRYQSAFRWESSFAIGDVPEVHTVDAQMSYRLPSMKSILKLGGSNIFNERYILNFGGPTIGAIYYVSITFDELFN
ncbi:TonB-dependent receptor plug domain-containing protein [Nitritalea halalkaliphila]|uniref:TonB-dependent receptor plug domain-containing protein n=1 Tax=Nitritalea halalkaliphila TaxID=590849 RepID=UPI00293418AD|nr:TonB-dependent receptor [Nitritalea halalkaliphila]